MDAKDATQRVGERFHGEKGTRRKQRLLESLRSNGFAEIVRGLEEDEEEEDDDLRKVSRLANSGCVSRLP